MIKAYNNDMYPRSALLLAIDAYSNIADIHIESKRNSHVCTFEKKEVPLRLVVNEFGNYIIELMNCKK